MKIFLDTNVLLDVLAHREPFYRASARIWSLAETGEVEAYISATSFNNIYYIVRKAAGNEEARKALRLLRDVFTSMAPDSRLVSQAIDLQSGDFEVAVQLLSATRAKADFLITRDAGDFPRSDIAILTPEEFLVLWAERGPESC
jgi:predicted nucleic acid-binding protein